MATSLRVDGHRALNDEHAAFQEQKRALNEEARQYWGDSGWMSEMATTITETIYQGFDFENLLQLMTVLENVGEFDRVTIREARGMKAYWLARGGYIQASNLQADVTELPRDIVGFHVYDETDKFRGNFAETQGDLVDLGIKRMDSAVNQKVLGMFQEAVPEGSDFYHAASGIDLDIVDTALDEVFDQTLDGMVTIFGRRTMTGKVASQLLGNNSFAPETNQEIIRTGLLGIYRGARLVTLKNFKDDLEIPFFPANELWVVGRDASKCAFWGGMAAKEYEEDDDWYWHYLAKREFGGMVHRVNRLRRIVDSDTLPTAGSGGSYTFP